MKATQEGRVTLAFDHRAKPGATAVWSVTVQTVVLAGPTPFQVDTEGHDPDPRRALGWALLEAANALLKPPLRLGSKPP